MTVRFPFCQNASLRYSLNPDEVLDMDLINPLQLGKDESFSLRSKCSLLLKWLGGQHRNLRDIRNYWVDSQAQDGTKTRLKAGSHTIRAQQREVVLGKLKLKLYFLLTLWHTLAFWHWGVLYSGSNYVYMITHASRRGCRNNPCPQTYFRQPSHNHWCQRSLPASKKDILHFTCLWWVQCTKKMYPS